MASYIFYCFAGVKFLVYIFATTVSTYLISKIINNLQIKQAEYLERNKDIISRAEKKEYKEKAKSIQKRWIALCLLINFGILGVLKYIDFSIGNINTLIHLFKPEFGFSYLKLAIPLGISFYTFQSMGYLIDVYRGKYRYEKNILRLALFISYFPQLIQGPISRFDHLKSTLFGEHKFDKKNISFGFQRVLWGYFKKLVIADRLLVAVSTIVGEPQEYTGIYVVIGMFFYAIQLYTDFSGGIDITIGISEMLGIRLKENFLRPFFSKSIAEYWRRWHISLGTWFKDYMFYPISVSKPVINLSRKCRSTFGIAFGKRVPIYVSSVLIWFTTGIWHGSTWNFAVWGLLNAVVILASHELTPLYNRFHSKYNVKNRFSFRLFRVIRTFWLIAFLRTLDCYPGVGNTFTMIGTIFTKSKLYGLFNGSLLEFGLELSDYFVLIIALVVLLSVSLLQRKHNIREVLLQKPTSVRYCLYFILFLSIVVFGAYGEGYEASQFIYSQF